MGTLTAEAGWMREWLEAAGYTPVAYGGHWAGGKCVAVRTSDSPFLMGASVARKAGDDAWMLGNFSMRAEAVADGAETIVYFPSLPWVEAAEQVAA